MPKLVTAVNIKLASGNN